MAIENLAMAEQRRVVRDEVFHRTRGQRSDGRSLSLLIVNISPCGLMARCEETLVEGERVHITLPGLPNVAAEVRWSLGGRMGCEFDRTMPLAGYYESLATMLRG